MAGGGSACCAGVEGERSVAEAEEMGAERLIAGSRSGILRENGMTESGQSVNIRFVRCSPSAGDEVTDGFSLPVGAGQGQAGPMLQISKASDAPPSGGMLEDLLTGDFGDPLAKDWHEF